MLNTEFERTFPSAHELRLRHAVVSLAVVSGLALLAIAKHLGLFGFLYSLLRRRSRD